MKKNNIGNQIKKTRIYNGWSQKEFAKKIDVHQPKVSSWERGANTPNYISLMKIAKVANITLEELLGEEKPKTTALSEVAKENLKTIQSYAHLAKLGQFNFNEVDFANFVYEKTTEILEELDHE